MRAMVRENLVTPKYVIFRFYLTNTLKFEYNHQRLYIPFIHPRFGLQRRNIFHARLFPTQFSKHDGGSGRSYQATMHPITNIHTYLHQTSSFNSYGVSCFILFPKVPENLKTNYAEEAYNPNGIVPRALGMLKMKFPNIIVCTDIALDPYSSMVNYSLALITRKQLIYTSMLISICYQHVVLSYFMAGSRWSGERREDPERRDCHAAAEASSHAGPRGLRHCGSIG